MVSFNKITIIGYLGRDPEMRYTASGTPVTDFSVATTYTYTDASGERREETDWFRVSAWNRLAEQCNQYLTKGRLVYVEGRLHIRQYEGNDGVTRHSNDVRADAVRFLGSRPEGSGFSGGDYSPGPGAGVTEPDDLPF